MALGFVAGIALSILTEGAAMPVTLTLMATVAGDAAIGAGAELATEAIDGQRISWGQVGIAAGLSAGASLAGLGLGRLSKLKGTSNRPFGGLMMESESSARSANGSGAMAGEFDIITQSRFFDDRRFENTISDHTLTTRDRRYILPHNRNAVRGTYTESEWVISDMYRLTKNVDYHVSDIVSFQYNAVSAIYNFSGTKPRWLKIDNIVNDELLQLYGSGLKNGRAALYADFFKLSAGKMVRHILDDHNWQPLGGIYRCENIGFRIELTERAPFGMPSPSVNYLGPVSDPV